MTEFARNLYQNAIRLLNEGNKNMEVFTLAVQCKFFAYGTDIDVAWCYDAFNQLKAHKEEALLPGLAVLDLFFKSKQLLLIELEDDKMLEARQLAFKEVEKLAKKGHPDALHTLALLKMYGHFARKNAKAAARIMTDLAREGKAEMKFETAVLALEGSLPIEPEIVLQLLYECKAAGFVQASYALGLVYSENKLVPRDMKKALEYFNFVKESLDVDNPLYLSVCKQLYNVYRTDLLNRNEYGTADLEKALELEPYLRSMNDIDACFNAVSASITEAGERNPALLQGLEQFFALNYPPAYEFLAISQEIGAFGVEKDPHKALLNYRKAADLKSSVGMFCLINIYLGQAYLAAKELNPTVVDFVPEAIKDNISLLNQEEKDLKKFRDECVKEARSLLLEMIKVRGDRPFNLFLQALTYADSSATSRQHQQAYDFLEQALASANNKALILFFMGIVHRSGILRQEVNEDLANKYFSQALAAYEDEGLEEVKPFFNKMVGEWITDSKRTLPGSNLIPLYGSLAPTLFLQFLTQDS